jgi:predicted ATP-dependent endonuclease of OLD family
MKVKSFRIFDYKCFKDSGLVETGNITALVGKNESGKTATLEALYKFNYYGEEKFARKDFPRSRSKHYDENKICITVTFSLERQDQKEISRIASTLEKVSEVQISKNYGNRFIVTFEPDVLTRGITVKELLSELNGAYQKSIRSERVDENNAEMSTWKTLIKQHLDSFTKEISRLDTESPEEILSQIKKLKNNLDLASNTDAKKSRIQDLFFSIEEIQEDLLKDAIISAAEDYILENVPRFIYFDEYNIINGQIDINDYLAKKEQRKLTGDFKTMKNLFDLSGLDVEQLQAYESEGDKESKSILCHQSSTDITGAINKYWVQRRYTVTFDVDGRILTVYVHDNVNPSPVALYDRGKGFRWYFSFYVNFNAETKDELKDCVLLLDEPGLHLHASAQEDLLRVIEKLSQKNQIIYTTHSPFMIYKDKLETVHTVNEDKTKESTISAKYWGSDKDTLFPLRLALGYSLGESLFIGKNNLVVEGISDFWILASLSSLFQNNSLPFLDERITITPVGGASKAYSITAFLVSEKLNLVVLLDNDGEGKSTKDELVKKKILKECFVLTINEAVNKDIEMQLEDLFPADFYLNFVNRAYEKELRGKKIKKSEGHPCIVKYLEKYFRDNGLGDFFKTRVARMLLDHFKDLNNFDEFSSLLKDNFKNLFEKINNKFSHYWNK